MSGKTRRQQLEEMLADEPNDPFLRYGVAMECVSEGKDQEAADRFRDIVALAPDYVPAYHQAGQTLVRLGRAQEAGGVLRQGIQAAQRQGNFHAAEEMQALLDSLG
jgi:predicted Zn-dependent protease